MYPVYVNYPFSGKRYARCTMVTSPTLFACNNFAETEVVEPKLNMSKRSFIPLAFIVYQRVVMVNLAENGFGD